MRGVIIKMPELPELAIKKRRAGRIRRPKLKNLSGSGKLVLNGVLTGLRSGSTSHCTLILNCQRAKGEAKVTGAGRGGKHYCKKSAMGQMADCAVLIDGRVNKRAVLREPSSCSYRRGKI